MKVRILGRALVCAVALLCASMTFAQLGVEITETGVISLSADGAGTTASSTTIHVDKPSAGATVRGAYFTCSATFRSIADGEVSLGGVPITWDSTVTNGPFPFGNGFADVTAIVAPPVDAAPAGLVGFTQAETDTLALEGCGLYVIFDDPVVTTDNTIFILFGGQDPAGDSFNVTLAEPLDAADTAELGLAISFSAQDLTTTGSQLCGVDTAMFSQVDVNGSRLTTCAGNEDDALPAEPVANGNLITVGGIGDDVANPGDPFQESGDGLLPRVREDERYDLKPFVPGTSINIDTINPSDDDNIFAGHILVTTPAIVGEGIILGPPAAQNEVGTDHTVTATVVDTNGDPVAGRDVTFLVVSGPNAGDGGVVATNASGEADFTYTGDGGVGIDTILATFVDSQGVTQTSNTVTKEWVQTIFEGACCDNGPGPESDCIIATQFDCEAAGGLYLGDGLACTDDIECSALVVTFESISAQAGPDGVTVRWTTVTEIDTIGFRVLRQTSDGRTKALAQVGAVVPGVGNGLMGGSYEVLDRSPEAADAVHYFLEDIDVFGRTTRHGPIAVERGSRQAPEGRTRR